MLRHHLWRALASEDVNAQHAKSFFGPAWVLINYLLLVGTFALIFGSRGSDFNFTVYIAIGLFTWFILADSISLSVPLFTKEENFITGTTLPLFIYALRLFMQIVIRTSYTLVGCIIVVIFSGEEVTLLWLVSLLGLFLIFASIPAAIVVLAFLGLYLPDARFLISNIVRLGMFLTPIFWYPSQDYSTRVLISTYNPFSYVIKLVRDPIVEGQVPIEAFLFCSFVGLLLWIAALFLLGKKSFDVAKILQRQ
jgi:lipopolysaccharide transport system permease protein